MPHERSANGAAARSPEERYRDFEKQNVQWDRRVRDALRELDKAAGKVKRAASRGRRTAA